MPLVFRTPKREACVAAAFWILASCTTAPPEATVIFGAGPDVAANCTYVAVSIPGPAPGYAVARIASTPVRLPDEDASLSGNLAGFGVRTVHDDTANRDVMLDIIYRTANYTDALNKISTFDCQE